MATVLTVLREGAGGKFRYLEIFDYYEGKVLTVLIVLRARGSGVFSGFDSFDSG